MLTQPLLSGSLQAFLGGGGLTHEVRKQDMILGNSVLARVRQRKECVSDKFSANADAAGLGPQFRSHWPGIS